MPRLASSSARPLPVPRILPEWLRGSRVVSLLPQIPLPDRLQRPDLVLPGRSGDFWPEPYSPASGDRLLPGLRRAPRAVFGSARPTRVQPRSDRCIAVAGALRRAQLTEGSAVLRGAVAAVALESKSRIQLGNAVEQPIALHF